MKFSSIINSLVIASSLLVANTLFAGTGKVNFGAYAAGQGCTGTGICNTGSATGANVTFTYYQNLDTAGHTYKRLTMVVNYDQAITYGFVGTPGGGTYLFTGGYPFTHPSDQNLGVPSSFSIPANYPCTYGPKDAGGRITLVIIEFTPKD